MNRASGFQARPISMCSLAVFNPKGLFPRVSVGPTESLLVRLKVNTNAMSPHPSPYNLSLESGSSECKRAVPTIPRLVVPVPLTVFFL